MKIYNTDKIKLKYILGIYKTSPDFPTGEDILYTMIKRAADRSEDMSDITFTSTKVYKKLGEEYGKNIEKSLTELVDTKQVEVIRETKDSNTYRILNNPYI